MGEDFGVQEVAYVGKVTCIDADAKRFEARPDLCAVDNARAPKEYIGKFYVDSLVHDAAALRYVLSVFGEKCVALGSDYPFPLGETRPGALIATLPELSPASRDRLLSGTALEWLGMRAEDFR